MADSHPAIGNSTKVMVAPMRSSNMNDRMTKRKPIDYKINSREITSITRLSSFTINPN